MKYTYEAYVDNAGTLHFFALDDEQNVVWGFYDYETENIAACDWLGLMVQEIDPVANGWISSEDITQDYKDCYESGFQIASSDWTHAPLGIDTTDLVIATERYEWQDEIMDYVKVKREVVESGCAALNFAIECEALYRCPECGKVGKGVLNRYEVPQKPKQCKFCGASLEE